MNEKSHIADRKVPAAERRFCRQCGAACRLDESRCWYCDHDPALPPSAPLRTGQFTLAMVLLFITVAAFCLGAFRWSLLHGIFVVALCAPALVRTVHASHTESWAGRRLSGRALCGQFVASLMVAIVASACGLVVFSVSAALAVLVHVITFGLGADELAAGLLLLLLGISLILALAAFCRVYWFLRPR